MRNRDHSDGGRLHHRLKVFAERVADDSPLYAKLAAAAVEDPIAHDILGDARRSQPAANMILAAVQYLLLEGKGERLARFYPALAGAGPPEGDPVPIFLAFIEEHQEVLRELVAANAVQTNEVRRCTALVPSFAAAMGPEPMALIEIGPSAGLNLLYDRYRYHYGPVEVGDPASPVILTTRVEAGDPPLPDPLPDAVWRTGIDLDPVDISDPSRVRWLRSLLWPESLERIARFEAAVEVASAEPPQLVKGSALEELTGVATSAPDGARLVVFHSYVLNQFTPGDREALGEVLTGISRLRPLDRIGMEMLDPDVHHAGITLTRYRNGAVAEAALGEAHHHGEWLRWA